MTIEKMKYDIVGNRWLWFTISIALVVIGLIFMVRNVVTDPVYHSPLRLGLDFSGGAIIQLQFDKNQVDMQKVGSEAIYKIAESITAKEPQIQITDNTIGKLVHIRADATMIDTANKQKLIDELATQIGPSTEVMSEEITPVISRELLSLALKALLVGSIFILIYITMRMSLDFAVFAVVAMLHDLLVLSGIFAMFQIEINSYFVAAMLTILGYSINDTVVIYDRIRENSKIYRRHPFDRVVNLSLLQTMTRSVTTGTTTLITIFILFFIGGASIKDFMLALAIGIISGTYSSIFNAAQLLVSYRLYKARGRMIAAEESLSQKDTEELKALDESDGEIVREISTAAKKKRKRRY
jgi:preprotein translocase subunit SecF